MHNPARLFLSVRALGAPAVVVSLAIQGVFRGLKDTKTPLLYSGKSRHLVNSVFASSRLFHCHFTDMDPRWQR